MKDNYEYVRLSKTPKYKVLSPDGDWIASFATKALAQDYADEMNQKPVYRVVAQ